MRRRRKFYQTISNLFENTCTVFRSFLSNYLVYRSKVGHQGQKSGQETRNGQSKIRFLYFWFSSKWFYRLIRIRKIIKIRLDLPANEVEAYLVQDQYKSFSSFLRILYLRIFIKSNGSSAIEFHKNLKPKKNTCHLKVMINSQLHKTSRTIDKLQFPR